MRRWPGLPSGPRVTPTARPSPPRPSWKPGWVCCSRPAGSPGMREGRLTATSSSASAAAGRPLAAQRCPCPEPPAPQRPQDRFSTTDSSPGLRVPGAWRWGVHAAPRSPICTSVMLVPEPRDWPLCATAGGGPAGGAAAMVGRQCGDVLAPAGPPAREDLRGGLWEGLATGQAGGTHQKHGAHRVGTGPETSPQQTEAPLLPQCQQRLWDPGSRS